MYEEMKHDAYLEEKENYLYDRKMEDDLEFCLEEYSYLVDNINELKLKLCGELAKHGHMVTLKDLDSWI